MYVPSGTSHPTCNYRIEAMHRLNNQGAVVAFAAYGTTQDGFEAEWRAVTILDIPRRPD